ncbi:unnamed protein product [Cunninghamella echinulata]
MVNSNTIRSLIAKVPFVRNITTASPSNWSREHLSYFNINIGAPENFNDFFGRPMPETYNEDVTELLRQIENYDDGIDYSGNLSQNLKNVLNDLESVIFRGPELESCVDDFSRNMLQLFGYEQNDLRVAMNPSCTLYMNNNTKKSIPNTSLKLNDQRLLLIQENKSYNVGLAGKLPEPQMIAQVIAALQFTPSSNVPLQQQFFPAIIMLGTQPTFYLIPVHQELFQAVRTGSRPTITTEVRKYTILNSNQITPAAMLEPNRCREIAACYTAFREFTRRN